MKQNGGNVKPVKLTALLDQLEKTHEELENLQVKLSNSNISEISNNYFVIFGNNFRVDFNS